MGRGHGRPDHGSNPGQLWLTQLRSECKGRAGLDNIKINGVGGWLDPAAANVAMARPARLRYHVAELYCVGQHALMP